MCGITGIVDLRGAGVVDETLLKRMNAMLSHRGPDGDGFHIEPGVGLGHRRLSIIDLEGGKQPLYNEDHSVVVTFNGEIFNYQEIEAELLGLGHRFRTRSDTEVIVHAWEQWGVDCLKRFNGMFAFAIWDRREQSLFIARDRLGVKPLFYAVLADGTLVFGSELKAITLHPKVPRVIHPEAVEDYFAFGYVPDPRTIYRDVHKLAPGHYLYWKRGQSRPAPVEYWDVPRPGQYSQNLSVEALGEQLRERLKEAVRKRLISDVPLGAFLSGGIDSSAVVAMMREIGAGEILTCSIGFQEPKYDESAYAKMVADAKRTNHKTEVVEASDYSLLEKLVDLYDEPFADSSAIPTYRVCQLARRHVTVALSGDGGDEDFIGYRRYMLFAMEQGLRDRLPLGLRKAVFGPLARWYPKLDWAPQFVRGKTTFQALTRSTADAYLHSVAISTDEVRRELFSGDFRSTLAGYNAGQVYAGHLKNKEFANPLAMVQYLDYKTYLPGDILTKVDRASMAHSLEVRTPFLDYEFVEWAAQVPTALKLHGKQGKHILKEALRPLLPDDVLFRKKMGFGVPLENWFRGSLKNHIADTIRSGHLKTSGMFDGKVLDRLLDQHNSHRRDHSAILWSLLMFEGFLRRSSGEPPSGGFSGS